MEDVRLRDMRGYKRAFVLINVNAGTEQKVAEKLLALEGVKEIHIIPGNCDIAAVLEVKGGFVKHVDEQIGEVVDKIRRLPEITHTETIIPLTSWVKQS